MQLKIQNGVVELSGEKILSKVNFEINDNSKIAVVGRNGCGKTTLLKLIAGDYKIVRLDSDKTSFFTVSAHPKISMLSQMTFEDDNRTLLEEIRLAYSEILEMKERLDFAQAEVEREQTEENIKRYTDLLDCFTNLGGFYFEKEYESALKSFGFTADEKQRPLHTFSGGQRTKIAFLKLLLSKPDILLLDEPTNHLDIEATQWLEEYLKAYKKAFVVVSHDRMFLDNVAETVYEIEHGKTNRYVGNYSAFVDAKKLLREQQKKDFEAQQKEIARLENLVDRFRYKATKATMAQSKLKYIEKMEILESPEAYDLRTFHADFEPEDLGVKDMLSVKNLTVGYDKPLCTVDLEVHKGEKIGIVGSNGIGKSTFIRTLVGAVEKLSGEYSFSSRARIGYFDQQMAQYSSNETILDDFMSAFPSLTEREARSTLGAFLFSGEDVFKRIDMLSGGERVRLALCKIFKNKPNFLILDEPTNHMDIVGKETLEEMLVNFSGTVLFVSHDRYFIKKIADKILEFRLGGVKIHPYGYEQYIQNRQVAKPETVTAEKAPKPKKTYTTPAKEKAKRERAIKKAEERIAELEKRAAEVLRELESEENISDFVKLSELQNEQFSIENEISTVLEEWEKLCEAGL